MHTPLRAALKAALTLFSLLATVACAGHSKHRAGTEDAVSSSAGYVSPYRTAFRLPQQKVEAGFEQSPWGDDQEQAVIPADEWYSRQTRRRWGSWGPSPRRYPEAPGWSAQSLRWLQERVLRVALHHRGLPYQHHHIPAWDPPAGWPWKPVKSGHGGPGLDCSNFTGFVYNYALGIKMSTSIREQATMTEISAPGESGVLPVRRIDKQDYDTTVKQLQPADLLYIRNKSGDLAHVIMWLGDVGVSPDGTPLVIDSTGSGHKDSNGNVIPDGVQIRPFTRNSWYWNDFDHAHRILTGLKQITRGAAPELTEGGADQVSLPDE
ncbi:MAG: NlpC/P60 family protein [Methylococcus sp.]|nr:NlpC/P60 family protein [Methylococcus sp.]